MSLYSVPLNDGTGRAKITVDFPYALAGKRAKYFQYNSKEDATDAAVSFMNFLEKRGHAEIKMQDNTESQVLYVYSLAKDVQ